MSENFSVIFIQQQLRLINLSYQSPEKTDTIKQIFYVEFTIDILRWNCGVFTDYIYHLWGCFLFM